MLRTEYPRPQFARENWLCLNGEWDFDFDDNNRACREHWEKKEHRLTKKIQVPFCYESKLSGIQDNSIHNHVFYKREFSVPAEWTGKRIHLHFEAVDYQCKVFINEKMCKEHTGGNIGFSVDITDYLVDDIQSLSVWVCDPAEDETIPRGKQFWEIESAGIWYTRTTGIWQSVWIEPVEEVHITNLKYTPDFDADSLILECEFSEFRENMNMEIKIHFEDDCICSDTYYVNNKYVFKKVIHLAKDHIFNTGVHGAGRTWTPENPALYDIDIKLTVDGKVVDEASGYFGMRKIHTENGITFLNNRPYYFKLVLDQGYWRDGILTAPRDEDFIYDIQIMKDMGFNGCRKHQKVEDARFLYHADKMGFLVWGEMAAACIYTDQGVENYAKEWFEIIRRDYNHPSIVAWVPFNESWAVPNIDINKRQQDQTMGMYYMIKSLDPSRLVINNDGWEMTKSDICAIHNYSHGTSDEPEKQRFFKKTMSNIDILLSCTHAGRNIYARNYQYSGEPILITECGGINYNSDEKNNWGYTSASSEEDYLSQYEHVISGIMSSDIIYGFCYTQLSDVEQETNGLLTYDRKPKCDPKRIKAINNRYRHNISLPNTFTT